MPKSQVAMNIMRMMYVGLATVMMAILLGSALLVPNIAYAAEDKNISKNDKGNHDKITKDKDRKDKDNTKDKNKGKGNNCDSEKYDKQCKDDGKDKGKDDGNVNNKDNGNVNNKDNGKVNDKDNGKNNRKNIAVVTSNFEIPSR
jgi:hypothetical protein